MRVLLINPPYQTFTANLGTGHQVPLGLILVGGALIDAGHDVRLLDAEERHASIEAIVAAAADCDVAMLGHAGSTPAHSICLRVCRAIRAAHPRVRLVYGGVYPSYHASEILRDEPSIDAIVRGEGEATIVALVAALAADAPLDAIEGITYRDGDAIRANADRVPIADLDRYRAGWELIEDWDRYQCFGLGRAAIVQFSRGCPHRCTYCGQHAFWSRWRHRDPLRVADEIEYLARVHRVRFVTLADENPTTDRALWQTLLEEVARRDLGVHFFATIRATDIVRLADLLPLARRAGLLYVLMGIETTDADVMRAVKKGSTPRVDREACRLLREAGIRSVLGLIVGLETDSWASLRRTSAALREYDGDYLNAMYVTPHDWTPFGQDALAGRDVVEPDPSRWDYRHQVLAGPRLRPWQLFAAVKAIELRFHLDPRRVRRALFGSPFDRRQWMWVVRHIGLVWLAEIGEFVWRSLTQARRVTRVTRRTRRALPQLQHAG